MKIFIVGIIDKMQLRILQFFLFSASSLFCTPSKTTTATPPKQIELFLDYRCDAKELELFPIPENSPLESWMLTSRIRKELLELGWDIKSWDRHAYRPWLLSWQLVSSWQEFQWWLGFHLPADNPFKENTGYWIFWGLGPHIKAYDFRRVAKEKLVLFIWEPPTVQPESYDPKIQAQFGKIFTWDDDLVDGKRFFKFHYPVLQSRLPEIPSFEEKKFCTLIGTRLSSNYPKELYSAREATIRFFEDKEGQLDLYGKYWEKRNYKNYKGPIPDKLSVLKNYKFCICYENTRDVKGYITEKIFDCFAAGSVPVYWGASNITDYIPAGCFIDRRQFQTEQELYDFLVSMPKTTYNQYLIHAQDFLKSNQAKCFTTDHFLKTFLQIIK